MAGTSAPASGPARRNLIALIGVAVGALAIIVVSQLGTLFPGGPAATGTPTVSPAPSTIGVLPSTAPPATLPPPSAEPTPVVVPAPLTGVLVSPEEAARHPIAVMIDDHFDARPQSGFNSASVVWHAPAEGGIPRYMLIFQNEIPKAVGPVRSARQYYIEWAAEWRSMYVHAGGSPQALATLRAKGSGQWVYNADDFVWEGRYLWRTTDRLPPHNVYSDGKHLRQLAKRLGAKDGAMEPAWSFGPDKDLALRPDGGRIEIRYGTPIYETVVYRYDRETNTYVRYACAYACEASELKRPQRDAADGKAVAPKNVVILRMAFGALNDGHPEKHRLEAHNIGRGEAWIATGGVTVKGEWRKRSATGATRLFGPDGERIVLTAGQTFVQVIPLTYGYKIRDGEAPAATAVSPMVIARLGF